MPVIGYSTHIVAACDLPEETVYTMTKAMAQNVDAMSAVNKAIAGLTPKDMAVDIGVPLHKGAREVLQGSRRASERSTPSMRRGSGAAAPVPLSRLDEATDRSPTKTSRPRRRSRAAVAVASSRSRCRSTTCTCAGFGPPEAVIFRGTHLLFALTLVFLLYPVAPHGGGALARARPRCCSRRGWGIHPLHLPQLRVLHQPHHLHRRAHARGTSSSPSSRCWWCSKARGACIGWALPLTAVAFLVYAVFFTQVKSPC